LLPGICFNSEVFLISFYSITYFLLIFDETVFESKPVLSFLGKTIFTMKAISSSLSTRLIAFLYSKFSGLQLAYFAICYLYFALQRTIIPLSSRLFSFSFPNSSILLRCSCYLIIYYLYICLSTSSWFDTNCIKFCSLSAIFYLRSLKTSLTDYLYKYACDSVSETYCLIWLILWSISGLNLDDSS